MGMIERILFGAGAIPGNVRVRGVREWVLQAVVNKVRREALDFADRAASPNVVMQIGRIKVRPVSERASAALNALFDARVNPATAVASAVRTAIDRACVPRVRLHKRCAIDPLCYVPEPETATERFFEFETDDDEFDIEVEYEGSWDADDVTSGRPASAGTIVAEVEDELGRRVQTLSLDRLPIWFGRSEDCQVRLQARFACHKGLALVRGASNHLELLHRKSTNGIWVNQKPLEAGSSTPIDSHRVVIEFGYGVEGRIERGMIEANATSGDHGRFPRVTLLASNADGVTPIPGSCSADAPTPMPTAGDTVPSPAGLAQQPVGQILIETTQGQRVERLVGMAVIGRSGDIVAAARNVSKRHLELFAPKVSGSPWFARDISTNGTFCDGKQLPRGEITALPDQAEVLLGGSSASSDGIVRVRLGNQATGENTFGRHD